MAILFLSTTVFSIFSPTFSATVAADGEIYTMKDENTIVGSGGSYENNSNLKLDEPGNNKPTPVRDQAYVRTPGTNTFVNKANLFASSGVGLSTCTFKSSIELNGSNGTLKIDMLSSSIMVDLSACKNQAKLSETFTVANAEIFSTQTGCEEAGGAWTDGKCDIAPENIPGSANEETDLSLCGQIDPTTRWFLCPVTTALEAAIKGIDGLLHNLLQFDQVMFTDQSSGYKGAWSAFRTIALALIVIAGIAIVIGQAAGIQVLDAYTIKKALPRLVIAVIFISLSWPLMELIVTFINDLGRWMQPLIAAPFGDVHEQLKTAATGKVSEAIGTQFMSQGVVVGALLVLIVQVGTGGWTVAASLLLVGTMAVVVGLIVVAIRTALLTLAVIVAPLAIACMILPITEKAYDVWKKVFVSALVVYPIIIAFLTVGKVMALTTPDPFMALLFYFGPYFLIPFAFKMAGGIMGKIAGIAEGAEKGFFDRNRKYRAGKYEQGKESFLKGDRRTSMPLAKGLNAFHRRNALSGEGGWGVTRSSRDRYAGAVSKLNAQNSAKALEESGGRAGDDTANFLAMQRGMTRDRFISEYSQMDYDSKVKKAKETARINGTSEADEVAKVTRMSAAEASAVLGNQESIMNSQIGSDKMRATSFRAWATSGTAIDYGSAENNEKMLNYYGSQIANDGILQAEDVVATVKSNNARTDLNSAGFGARLSGLQKAMAAERSGNMTASERQAVFTQVGQELAQVNAADMDAGKVLMGNSRGIKYAAPMRLRTLEGASSRATEAAQRGDSVVQQKERDNFDQTIAAVANDHDNLSRTSQSKAQIYDEKVLSQKVTLPAGYVVKVQEPDSSAPGGYSVVEKDLSGTQVTVKDAMEYAKQNPAYHRIRREWGGTEAAARQAGREPDED